MHRSTSDISWFNAYLQPWLNMPQHWWYLRYEIFRNPPHCPLPHYCQTCSWFSFYLVKVSLREIFESFHNSIWLMRKVCHKQLFRFKEENSKIFYVPEGSIKVIFLIENLELKIVNDPFAFSYQTNEDLDRGWCPGRLEVLVSRTSLYSRLRLATALLQPDARISSLRHNKQSK